MTSTLVKDIKDHNETEVGINPKKFVLWLLIVASVMLFASFTSAYIVRRGEGNWNVFELPGMFAITSVIIALSSVTMQWAYISAKRDEIKQLKIALYATITLGVLFMVGQWMAWKDLVKMNVHFSFANPSESFIYVISGVHLAHIIAGILFLIVVLVKTFQFNVHKKNLLSINLCTTFWHFLGAIWLYLYFVLLLNR
jgi:cytochrome c oxidase subunit 3